MQFYGSLRLAQIAYGDFVKLPSSAKFGGGVKGYKYSMAKNIMDLRNIKSWQIATACIIPRIVYILQLLIGGLSNMAVLGYGILYVIWLLIGMGVFLIPAFFLIPLQNLAKVLGPLFQKQILYQH